MVFHSQTGLKPVAVLTEPEGQPTALRRSRIECLNECITQTLGTFWRSHLLSELPGKQPDVLPSVITGSTPLRVPRRVASAGCRSGVTRQRLSVDHRRVFPGDPSGVEPPRQPVRQPPESGQPASLTGCPRGSWKIGAVAGTHGPPHPLLVRVGRWKGDFRVWGYRGG